MQSSSSEKKLVKPLKINHFWAQLAQKKGVTIGFNQKTKKQKKFLQKKQNQIINFQEKLILSKYHIFWLSYECFSILYDVFMLKRVISSGNSCGNKTHFENHFITCF